MEESRQNPGETEAGALTPAPEDALEHVLDAWSSEPSTRKRYDRLRLERRDGQALDVLLDAETARDLGDKLTIVAARSRHRTRGAAGVPVDRAADPGRLEDIARARKVLALIANGTPNDDEGVDVAILAEEFCASREDVAKAYAMVDEVQARVRVLLRTQMQNESVVDALRAELASVKADRANLIAEAAQRDIEAGEGHQAIDLSDPSEPAPP